MSQSTEEKYKEALLKISTRKMSQYLSVNDMNRDFIKIAQVALEEKADA